MRSQRCFRRRDLTSAGVWWDRCDLGLGAMVWSGVVCASSSLALLSLLALSLSLRVSESGNDLKVKCVCNSFSSCGGRILQSMKWFSVWPNFPCTTKHTVGCKLFSQIYFQPKQTQSYLFKGNVNECHTALVKNLIKESFYEKRKKSN